MGQRNKRIGRATALLLASVLSLGSLVGCGDNNGAQSTAKDVVIQSATAGSVAGEGGEDIDNINAKTLDIASDQSGASISLRFVLGSQQTGDEAESNKVPKYRAYLLPSPSRFVLEFDNLDYWDFLPTLNIPDDDPYFYGVFNQIQLSGNNQNAAPQSFRIVFQLRQNVEVSKIEDKRDTLTVQLSPVETESKVTYHVMSSDEASFIAGKLVNSVAFFPSLSNDEVNKVLVSKPYDSSEQADAALKTVLSENSALLSEQNTFVVAIDGNSLPSYADSADYHDVFALNVIRRNGSPETLPVLMPDGLYHCSMADGSLSLFSKAILDEDGSSSANELWTLDDKGKFKRLTDIEFGDIAMAAFSPDGNRLALLERTSESSYLYIYDLVTNELDNLSEEGLGRTTSTFIWDALGTAIYAISGNESQQLLKYDFTIADTTLRVTTVEEQEIGEGDLGYYNGELYFTNVTDDDREVVFRIKPEGGLRSEFTEGGSFRIAPNSPYMAVLQSAFTDADESGDGEEELGSNQTTLLLYNMNTGEMFPVAEEGFVITFEWSTDGKLYYTMSISSDFSDEYSYRFMRYDPASQTNTEIADFISSDFAPAPDPNNIFIPLIRDDPDAPPIRATYLLRLD